MADLTARGRRDDAIGARRRPSEDTGARRETDAACIVVVTFSVRSWSERREPGAGSGAHGSGDVTRISAVEKTLMKTRDAFLAIDAR
jgi:hypothetical protein